MGVGEKRGSTGVIVWWWSGGEVRWWDRGGGGRCGTAEEIATGRGGGKRGPEPIGGPGGHLNQHHFAVNRIGSVGLQEEAVPEEDERGEDEDE